MEPVRREEIQDYQTYEEQRAEIRLLLVLLQVLSLRLGEHLPVEVPERIPRHVLPVLRELHAETVIGTAVETGDEAFDDKSGAQLHVRKLSYNARLKIFESFLHVWTYFFLRVIFLRLSSSAFADVAISAFG